MVAMRGRSPLNRRRAVSRALSRSRMMFSKLKRKFLGGSQEPLGTTPRSQHRPERATQALATPLSTFSTGPVLNGFPRPWVDGSTRPSSSPAHYREPQNVRSNGTTASGSRPTPLPQAQSPPARPPQKTINVILFGEAGVGKSAVVNLIAQRTVAKVSSNAIGCTMQSTPYDVDVDGTAFRIFDTVGLNQASEVSGAQVNAHLDAIEHAYKLICDLRAAGGVHLLLFCMEGSRVTQMTRNNYRLFAEFLCQRQVPVAVVATCLEWETTMEDWWTRNKDRIVNRFGIRNVGHACVTTLWDGDGSVNGPAKYAESQWKIRDVLRGCSLPRANGFQLETTNGVAMAATALRVLVVNDQRQPSSEDIKKRLSKHLKMDKADVKKILDIMNPQGTK